jgi:hypothetical protein
MYVIMQAYRILICFPRKNIIASGLSEHIYGEGSGVRVCDHNKIREFDLLIERGMIMGGEPLDQDHAALLSLIAQLKTTRKAVWVFTKYDFDRVPAP